MGFEKNLEEIKIGLKDLKKRLEDCKSDNERIYLFTAIGNSYLLISEVEDARNNIINALLSFDEVEKISKKTVNNEALANVEGLKGFLFYKLAFLEDRNYNLKISIEHYKNVINLTAEPEREKLISVNYNLANSYLALRDGKEQDNIFEAILIFNNALEIATSLGRNDSFSLINNALGRSYLLLSQFYKGRDLSNIFEKAIFFFEESLKYSTLNDKPFDFASSHNGLGVALMKMGDFGVNTQINYENALTHFNQALKFYDINSNPIDFASVNYTIGLCYFKLAQISTGEIKNGFLLKAKDSLTISTELFIDETNPLELANAEYYLSVVYKDLFDISHDKNFLQKEIESLYAALNFFNEENNPVSYASIQLLIGEALYKQGKTKDSLTYYSEAERVSMKFNMNLARQISNVRKIIQSLK